MVKMQKRINYGLEVLQYYTTKEWYFKNDNFLALQTIVSEEDNKTFYTDVNVSMAMWQMYMKQPEMWQMSMLLMQEWQMSYSYILALHNVAWMVNYTIVFWLQL